MNLRSAYIIACWLILLIFIAAGFNAAISFLEGEPIKSALVTKTYDSTNTTQVIIPNVKTHIITDSALYIYTTDSLSRVAIWKDSGFDYSIKIVNIKYD